ncbi:uncharacterized protein N7443_006427 [Penicillium atrosanguineum]|uniref:Cytochrome P450 n=1 Tax=Penicillium atrosanguineum TaxID=1132637 RepID=A0A9W9Q025_9EURO|nr:uncharacterized protein N7443_006427 [Penicillium atrosanguineum]KAJ5298307.1 hypothetical protein N7443_006427 [Penicillium atrosanguineum]KAJ5321426.1 Cytochrome P450 [Penicillium atrosanguineum]
MDPFSITVGALGITEFALSSISHLRDLVDGLKEANDVIQDVIFNLNAIQLSLSALKNLQFSDNTTYTEAKEDLKKTGVAEAVNNCGQACAEFSKKLEQWTKHSSSTKLSLRDRLTVGLWNKEKVQTFRTQVHSCQSIVHFAIDSASLIILVRSENSSKTAQQEKEKQLRVLETAIQEHIQLTERKQGDALQRKKDLEYPEDEDEDEGGDAQRTLAIQEIDKQSRLLEADQIASKLVSQTISKLSTREVGNAYNTYNTSFGGSNSGFQIAHSTGTINWNGSRT